MKKIIALVLALTMLLTFCACGSQASQDIGESTAAAENVKVESDQGSRPRKGPLKDLMDALFPEQEIWMGMPAAEYSGEVGEVQDFYNGELYRYLYLEEDCMAAGTELYFLENGGLSMVYAYGTQLTPETLSEICGDPMFFREVDWESVSYWIVEDNLLIYYSADARLELYTEGWAGRFCPEQWLTAKSGLILVSAGAEGLYWYQDILNWKYGLYEESTDSTLTEPLYDACGDFDPEGMAPVQRDGYWGYINAAGETVIGHYFESAEPFVGDCAVVEADKWGAIDRKGDYVVQPEYHRITIQDGFLIVDKSGRYGAFDAAGQSIVPVSGKQGYENITICNGILYAQYAERSYHAYDENGDRLLPEAECVTLPKNGFHIVRMPYESICGWTTSGYTFADEAFNVLGTTLYDELTDFSAAGYAVGSNNWESFDVIDTQGNVVYTLPELNNGDGITNYEYANSYLACGHYSMWTSFHYGVTNLETGIFTEYDMVEPVDGTECVIVTAKSGLKGLYERDELYFDCVYDDIVFDGEAFTVTRGAEVSTYVPTGN